MEEQDANTLVVFGYRLLDDYKEEGSPKDWEWFVVCTNDEKNWFSYNMITREALISTLCEGEFTEFKVLDSAHEICNRLEALYEGDKYTKQEKLQN